MNLFCFTLEGSTDSIYEPAYSQTLKEVLPKYQCSPALRRRKPEWGGSDPSINSIQSQSSAKAKRNNRRSCVPTSLLDGETLDKDISQSCWTSLGDKRDLSHQTKVQNKEMSKAPSQSSTLTRDGGVKELRCDRTQTHGPAQGGETAADTADSAPSTGRLKKLQSLVQTKKGHQSGAGKGKCTSENNDHLANVLGNSNPVLTCIGLGTRTEKKPSKPSPSPLQQRQQEAKDVRGDSDEEGVWSPKLGNYLWSPFECPQPWSPFYHTCHQPRPELWARGTLSLPQTTAWDRFESLIQELDSKQPDLSPPQTSCSITNLQLADKNLTRCDRFDVFRQHSPLMKPRDNDSYLQRQEQNDNAVKLRLHRRAVETSSPHRDGKLADASPEKTLTVISNGITQKEEAQKRGTGGGRQFTKGQRRSTNSLESLYSLNSGQSSSSGVTSGSDCSSNRDSLRTEDDLLNTRLFCGRARVHTDFVPSPYDTESLRLKVGDVIDIMAKPPMGIWRGMLRGRVGNFKFIYVDLLPDSHEETGIHRVRQRSTVREVLRRLSLEEYSSSLQRNGYQTVDDLMRLREHHLTQLNVTDPEHRRCLLAAVDSLQQLRSDSQSENGANQEAETPGENLKADTNNCPRDSGCHMPSDSSDNSTEDADPPFISEYPLPAEMTAS
ncbi:SAM domain-containing protein SAMSN-1b [Acanthopagrus schlegelii]